MDTLTTERPDPASPIQGLVRASLVFSVGAIAGKAFGIVLLPILTRLLSPDDLGRVDVTTTFATAVTVLAGFQLDFAVTRLYFDLPAGPARRRLLGAFLTLLAASTVPILLVVVLLRDTLSTILFGSPKFDALIVGGTLLIMGSVFRISVLTIARTAGRPSDYAWLSGGSLVLTGLLTVALLSAWQASALSVVLASAVAFAVTAVLGLILLRAEVLPGLSKANASSLARFGLPLLPAAIAAIGADLANRTFLLQAAGASQVAYLGVALRFASIAALALAAFQLAWQPRAYGIFRTEAGRRQIAAEGSAILVVLSVLSPAIGAITPEGLAFLAGQRYEVAGPAVGFGLIAALGSGGFLVASMSSLLARDARSVGIASALGVGVAVLANVVLARPFGSAGTAAAMATGQAASFVAIASLDRGAVQLPIPWFRVGATMVAASVLTLAFTSLSIPLALRIIAVTAFVASIASLNRPRRLLEQLRTLAAADHLTGETRPRPREPEADKEKPNGDDHFV